MGSHKNARQNAPAPQISTNQPSRWSIEVNPSDLLPGTATTARNDSWEVGIPLRTSNPLNGSWGSHKAQMGKRQRERAKVHEYLRMSPWRLRLPVFAVTLTRLSPQTMDPDGARAALKSVRDAIANFLGIDDREPGMATWNYHQERAAEMGVRIRIERLAEVTRSEQ